MDSACAPFEMSNVSGRGAGERERETAILECKGRLLLSRSTGRSSECSGSERFIEIRWRNGCLRLAKEESCSRVELSRVARSQEDGERESHRVNYFMEAFSPASPLERTILMARLALSSNSRLNDLPGCLALPSPGVLSVIRASPSHPLLPVKKVKQA